MLSVISIANGTLHQSRDEASIKDWSKILQTSTFLCYFGHVIRHVISQRIPDSAISEWALPKAKTDVIEVHISSHFSFVLSTVDSVIMRLLLSLAFMIALWRE